MDGIVRAVKRNNFRYAAETGEEDLESLLCCDRAKGQVNRSFPRGVIFRGRHAMPSRL